jgi:putative tricarboxylic transport membrane protein
MHDDSDNEDSANSVVSSNTMNMVVASLLMAAAAVVMFESYRLGAGWSPDVGPDSGYFPFYVALLLFLASGATLVQHALLRARGASRSFIAGDELKMVFKVLIPMTIFVVLSTYIGIYLSLSMFIACFMMWLGGYSIIQTLPVALSVPVILFVVFELWFLVPLPKGPIEAWLGY